MKRRTFLKTAGFGTLPLLVPAAVLGRDGGTAVSERINLGGIGINHRGGYVLGYFLDKPDVHFRAIADVRRDRREAVKQRADELYGTSDTAMYRDFRELLARPDIDAVLIATGDRWHTEASIAAARAGKHVYCEKPCALTIGLCQRLAEEVNKAGIIFQGGTQRRNVVNCRFACELARSGRLGKIHTVHASIYYLHYRTDWLEPEPLPNPDDIDWNLWRGTAPWRPYNHAYIEGQWRGHYDFDSGARHLDWGAHTVDLCQMALGRDGSAPNRYWSRGNRLYAEYDDGVELVMRPDGWNGLGTCPVRFDGEDGWVEVGDSGGIALSDPKLRPEIDHLLKKDPENKLSFGECPSGHIRDFLDCIKTGNQPAANVNVIRSSHIACHASALSWMLQRELRFDPVREEFLDDDEANRMRFRAERDYLSPQEARLTAEPIDSPEAADYHDRARRLYQITRTGTAADQPQIAAAAQLPRLATLAKTAAINIPTERREIFFTEKGDDAADYHRLPMRLAPAKGNTSLPVPRWEDLTETWNRYRLLSDNQQREELFDEMLLLCRRTPEPDQWSEKIAAAVKDAPLEEKVLACDLFFVMESPKSLACLADCAASSDDALADRATQRLGEWPNLGAAPTLLDLVKKIDSLKYRVRLYRGYLRLVRQMSDDIAKRLAMIDEAIDFAPREEERDLALHNANEIKKERRNRPLVDGQTFAGWNGDTENVFHIVDGAIAAGSLDAPNPHNDFLTTEEEYLDFDLTLEAKIEGEGGNAGIQFRSKRIPDHFEMIGYQADMTSDGAYWGSLYDESRRNRFLAQPDPEQIKRLYRPNEWNRYRIVCWGSRITIYLNGEKTVDYVETEFPPQPGLIGLQIHGGPPSRALYRDIRIEPFVLNISQ